MRRRETIAARAEPAAGLPRLGALRAAGDVARLSVTSPSTALLASADEVIE
jgi:hypothetical protein